MQTHLFSDADNTLWDTNAIFIDAQLSMLTEIEEVTGLRMPDAEDHGLALLRQIDQRIAASHPGRLRYPSMLLAAGLVRALKGENPNDAAVHAFHESSQRDPRLNDVVERFVERLKGIPVLRAGVLKGLEAANAVSVPVTVVTEEKLKRCQHLISVHNLTFFVQDVLSVEKTPEMFRKLREICGESRVLMGLDQLDRDIQTSRQAGFETFFYPSEFVPYWDAFTPTKAHHTISRYDELIPFLLS